MEKHIFSLAVKDYFCLSVSFSKTVMSKYPQLCADLETIHYPLNTSITV